jgi:glycosyltransferase 2 family protein
MPAADRAIVTLMPAEKLRKMPRWLPQALGFGVSLGSLIWVLHGYNFNELIPAIRSLDFRWLLLAVISDLSIYIAHAIRWKALLAPVARVRLWRTIQSIYIGLFANEVLPLRTGELIRCYLLAHWHTLRLSLGFSSAAVERLIDGLWMLGCFIATAAVVKAIPKDIVILVQILGGLLVSATVALIWIVNHKHRAHVLVKESRWASTLRHVIEGLHLMGNRKTIAWTSFLSLVYLALNVLFVYAMMRAYGLDLSYWAAGGVLTVVRFATVIPNAPGNIGLSQVAFVAALGMFDVSTNDAKTFSFIVFFAQNIPLVVGGAIAVSLTGLNIGELRDRARRGAETLHAPATERT